MKSHLFTYDLNDLASPQSTTPMPAHDMLLMCEFAQSPVIVYTANGELQAMNLNGDSINPTQTPVDDIRYITCTGSEIAFVINAAPTTVNIVQLGVSGQVAYEINASALPEEDAILETWLTPVDMENASIVDVAFTREHLAVTVNVSATDRLVLYNRSSATQWLASNPKYHASDPSIGHGVMAWSVRDHLNPLSPQDKYLDREIYFVELDANTTQILTSDTKEQWGPQVLEHHLVYFELDGEIQTLEIHSWEPELRLYSSFILQAGVLLAFVVVAWNMWQRQSERRTLRQP